MTARMPIDPAWRDLLEPAGLLPTSGGGANTKAGTPVAPFLAKLYGVLESGLGLPYIGWSSDGASVVVGKSAGLVDHVLSQHGFPQASYEGFVRMLCNFRFRRNGHVFTRQYFQRGSPEQLANIDFSGSKKRQCLSPPSARAPGKRRTSSGGGGDEGGRAGTAAHAATQAAQAAAWATAGAGVAMAAGAVPFPTPMAAILAGIVELESRLRATTGPIVAQATAACGEARLDSDGLWEVLAAGAPELVASARAPLEHDAFACASPSSFSSSSSSSASSSTSASSSSSSSSSSATSAAPDSSVASFFSGSGGGARGVAGGGGGVCLE